jgi:enoyl-CoA hydratase
METLLLEYTDSVLTITINREKSLNALNQQVLTELKFVLSEIKNKNEKNVRGIILTGSGDKAFIAGADIKAMSTLNSNEAEVFCALGQEVSQLFETVPVPVIACVNGFALGGGCEMAISCDFIYATKTAVFGQPEVNLGLIPGFGGTQRLSRFVGIPLAKEMIYTARNMKAEEAHQRGLAQKLFDSKEELLKAALETLKVVATKSPIIVAKCKEVIREGEFESIAKGLEIEKNGFKWTFETNDMREGVTAFMEKRAPQFTGK